MIGPEFPAVLVAAAGGDEEAFGSSLDLQPRLLRYFRVVSPVAAEDLASETWLGVVRGIDRFEGEQAGVPGLGVHHRPARGAGLAPPGSRRPTEDLGVGALTQQVAPDDPAADAMEGVLDPGRAGRGGGPPGRPGRGDRAAGGGRAGRRPGGVAGRSGRERSGCSPTEGCAGWPSGSAPTASGGWCNAMGPDDASSAEMRQPFPGPDADPLALDEATVERLLSGELAPEQAPPQVRRGGQAARGHRGGSPP